MWAANVYLSQVVGAVVGESAALVDDGPADWSNDVLLDEMMRSFAQHGAG